LWGYGLQVTPLIVKIKPARVHTALLAWLILLLLFFFFFAVMGLELRVFTLSHSTSPIFCDRVFRDRGCELFAWAGFKL
jgi:hypothetical protein